MNKRLAKFISVMLSLVMVFSLASCSRIEDFFDLDHDNVKHHRRDDDDDDRDSHKKPGRDDEDEEETEPSETEEPEEIDVEIIDDELTYPDHIPTLEELHPAHAPGTISGQEASDLLDELEQEYLQRTIGSSYVNAEIYYDDPSSVGVTVDEVSWGDVTTDSDEDIAYYSSTLETLYSIDYESLDYGDRAFYDKFVYDLQTDLYVSSYSAFGYYSPIFDPLIGPQCEVMFLLDVLSFDTVEDAENYIIILNDLDRFYDEIASFEEERAEKGFACTDSVYNDIADSFEGLAAQEDDCFLYESFETRLDAIEGLSDADRARLISEHEDVMHNVVFPEFQECADRMRALVGSGGVQQGICAYPGGQAYYTVLFMNFANSTKSIEESTASIDAMLDSCYATMMTIAMDTQSDWMTEYMDHNYSQGDTMANLVYLETAVQPDFPDLPEHEFFLRDVPEALQDNFSPAAFLGYHLDRNDHNMIITNQASVSDTFGVTCAHEGYPGHMFQSVYTRNICDHPYLYLNDSIGYTEGWATYVENYSFKYFTEPSNGSTLVQIENELNVLLFARLDIGINYEGWDAAQCDEYCQSVLGYSLGSSVNTFYEIVTNQPGYGVKYGVGFVNTGLVMTQAHRDFPDATDEEIHTAYLNALPLTFEMIYERMQVELSSN